MIRPAAVLAMVFVVACSTELPVQVVPDIDPNTCCPATEPTSEATPIVVVDDSMSMRGYLQANGPEYQSIVNDAVMELASSSPRTTVRRLSKLEEALNGTPTVLLNTHFYTKSRTPLIELFHTIAHDSGHSLWVIITDLRQTPMDFTALTAALHSALDRYPYVALVGYNLCHSDAGPAHTRPLYVLAFAESQNDMRWLDDYTSNESRSFCGKTVEDVKADRPLGPYVFRSRPAVTYAGAEEDFDSASREHWNRFADPKKTACPTGQTVVCSDLSILTAEKPSPIAFRVTANMTFALRDPMRVEISAYPEGANCRGDSHSGPLPHGTTKIEGSAFDYSANSGELDLRAEYNLPLPKGEKPESYRVEYKLGNGNALPPDWIQKWSTSREDDPIKTLNLGPIAETILRHVTERDAFLIHHVVVRKGA